MFTISHISVMHLTFPQLVFYNVEFYLCISYMNLLNVDQIPIL